MQPGERVCGNRLEVDDDHCGGGRVLRVDHVVERRVGDTCDDEVLAERAAERVEPADAVDDRDPQGAVLQTGEAGFVARKRIFAVRLTT